MVRKMTEEMVFDAWKRMLVYFERKLGKTLEELCTKPLEETLSEDDYLLSKYLTRLLVALDMGLIGIEDAVLSLKGLKVWWPDDAFQKEYENHWNNLVTFSHKRKDWFKP